ncbi:MAG: UDPGP type 1 family protein [Kiritimatiellaeota bacterium]|nr:UDPGP type 1 family protein [Kiritimatiellota bacterium]
MDFEELSEILTKNGQNQLAAHLATLDQEMSAKLAVQLRSIDFTRLSKLIDAHVLNPSDADVPEMISPAPYFPLKPLDSGQESLYQDAERRGRELLDAGEVCALTVAGGQGSRLGFDGPKGTYPVTPLKKKTLFQYFAESIARAAEKFGSPIPWYIMTSEVNDADTRSFFERNAFFGLNSEDVFFFTQGTMPAIGMDGKLLLSARGSLALAPDGHGGTLLALRKSGALDDMRRRGIEHISYFQVDNPLVSVVNTLFIGLHALENSEMSSRALIKAGPNEKLGNFCLIDGRLSIIEYSDMPAELAEKRDPDGRLTFRAGSPAIHILSRSFVERLTEDGDLRLPWHRAEKKVPYVTPSGEKIVPVEPNAVKLETFIFDAIPKADRTMVLEAERGKEFAPVKNKSGVDSAESCGRMLVERDAEMLESVGAVVPRAENGSVDCIVELSPRTFFDSEDVETYFLKNGRAPNVRPKEECYYE